MPIRLINIATNLALKVIGNAQNPEHDLHSITVINGTIVQVVCRQTWGFRILVETKYREITHTMTIWIYIYGKER